MCVLVVHVNVNACVYVSEGGRKRERARERKEGGERGSERERERGGEKERERDSACE